MKNAVRFAAKLLFQFRVHANGTSNRRRLCEERIVVFEAPTAELAVKRARSMGTKAQHRYKNNAGGMVDFEFVGILELLSLEPECEEGEVWYELRERVEPKENARRIIPPVSELNAVKRERHFTARSGGRKGGGQSRSRARRNPA